MYKQLLQIKKKLLATKPIGNMCFYDRSLESMLDISQEAKVVNNSQTYNKTDVLVKKRVQNYEYKY